MSAHFFLKFRGQYVRITYLAGKTVAQLVDSKQATPFTSEADAWTAACQHHLQSDWCEVENPSAPKQSTGELNLA